MDSFDPYERENLIFIDTEFSSLDPNVGEILSIGIVKLDGEELYIELESNTENSEWVNKHVAPNLKQEKISQKDAINQITHFLGGTEPFAVCFVDNYDVIYLTKIFGHGKLPFRWVTIDFASILFANGINPVKFTGDRSGVIKYYKKLGININKYRQHHALDDAKLLRDVWQKILHTK